MNYMASINLQPLRVASAANENHVLLAKLLSGYCELVTELGGQPDALLAGVKLTKSELEQPFAMVSLRATGQLLEASATTLGCPDFGLRLAERQSIEAIMQPLDRLFRTAPTVRDALEYCSRHIGVFNSGLLMEVDGQDIVWPDGESQGPSGKAMGGLHLVDFKLLDGLSLFPQFMEHLLLLTHKSIVWLSAGFAKSRAIWFSHLNISAPVVYARHFNTVVKFGQEYDSIHLSDADLATKIAGCDAELFASEARLAAERFPARDQEIDVRVRLAILRALTRSEDCNRHNIARLLGFQERTLNRHLYKKGTSFESIRDEVRRNLAFRYLARADLSLCEIAGRLGYSELAVLSRCCRRWFGMPPRQLRQDLLPAQAAIISNGDVRLIQAARRFMEPPGARPLMGKSASSPSVRRVQPMSML
jgi:AraC-like DNA-binding protein